MFRDGSRYLFLRQSAVINILQVNSTCFKMSFSSLKCVKYAEKASQIIKDIHYSIIDALEM